MARQPTKSLAIALTTTRTTIDHRHRHRQFSADRFNQLARLILIGLFVTFVSDRAIVAGNSFSVTGNGGDVSDFYTADASAVRSASEIEHVIVGTPKFGDRISPRHRPRTATVAPVPNTDARKSRGAAPYQPVDYLSAHYPIYSTVDGHVQVHSLSVDERANSRSVGGAGGGRVRGRAHAGTDRNLDSVEDYDNLMIPELIRESGILSRSSSPLSSSSSASSSSLAPQLKQSVSSDLSKASAKSTGFVSTIVEITRKNDVLPSMDVLNSNNDNITVSAQAHRLEMSTEFFVVPPSPASSIVRSTTIRPGGVVFATKMNNHKTNATMPLPPIGVAGIHPTGLRKEPWVVPVLVLAALSMLMMAAFEVFVLCKAWRTSPSRRHLFLGQMLLLGLFACSGLAAVLTATPTLLTCATVRFGAGVAFALVFASLLVKCVFLISLNGGVYLPAPYQGLLLLFAVLIQVAVGAQWLLTSPPAVDQVSITIPMRNVGVVTNTGTVTSASHVVRHPVFLTANDLGGTSFSIPLCRTQFSELLLSLVYVVFLILFVAILAIKSRGIRDNYREATYIGLAIGGAIPIWLAWTMCGLAVADRHRDACLAFGLIASSATVFLVMFMPKGRQLAAMGKEGLYVEDREERFSSLSHAGSGYSPSFFHFKPIKYGVMNTTAPTSNTNTTGNGGTMAATNIICNSTTNGKHQAIATLGGDRVALVAAPPSYTRMYHYFPAHLTHPFCYYPTQPTPQTYPGLFIRPDDANLYTTLEPTMSSNPNVYFQRGGGVHPGMMY